MNGRHRLVLRVGDWATLGDDAMSVRRAVFVVEQGIDESLEIDAHDRHSIHAVVRDGELPVATGRLLPDGRIGRMAVLVPYRRAGVGGRVLARLIEIAEARGDATIELSSQAYVCAFYERHGFERYGPVHDDEGIPHQAMRRKLR